MNPTTTTTQTTTATNTTTSTTTTTDKNLYVIGTRKGRNAFFAEPPPGRRFQRGAEEYQ